MFKNYLRTALRNLFKNKFYTFINILGLTAGLAIGILILLWIQNELSFDKFHRNASNVYRVNAVVGTGTSKQTGSYTPGPVATSSLSQIPEVKNAVRITGNYDFSLFSYKDKKIIEKNIGYTDPSLFSVFDFKLLQGNSNNPFPNDNSIIITTSTAKKYFGNEEPIGKILVADNKEPFVVNGILKDFPDNSSIKYDMLFPISLLGKKYDGSGYWKSLDTDWGNYNFNTYLQLQSNASTTTVEEKVAAIHYKNQPEVKDKSSYSLQPFTKIHLYQPDGNDAQMKSVRIFFIIAILILVIACINYVNLSTARALVRSKEVSVRKIIGAGKGQLFLQFVTETALIFVFVTILALGTIKLLMPLYNNVTGKNLQFSFLNADVWVITLITIVTTLAASSIYPAILLSSFEPIKALKGKILPGSGNINFRKVLVITQFVFSVSLIIGTVIISRQLKYIHEKELGYDKDHVLSLEMREMQKHYDAVKTQLQKQPGVTGVTSAGANIIHVQNTTGDADWNGKEQGRMFLIHPLAVDENFIPLFKMKLEDGTNFSGAVTDTTHFILNETALKQAGIQDPIGKRFKLWQMEGTIIGVVKDFHFTSLKEKIEPAIFYYKPANDRLFIKTTGQHAPKVIGAAEKLWRQYNSDFPFEYNFLDETYNELYKTDERTGLLFNVFAIAAILISCLGLFGLATYTAQVKTKEIGIRKVLGASVASIVTMLSKDFLKLVFIASIIAFPLSWLAMNKWLEDFAYRVNISWLVFAAAGIAALIIALMAISFQAVKAALSNPVKSLRTE